MMNKSKMKKSSKGSKRKAQLMLTNSPNSKGTIWKGQIMLTNSPNFKIVPVHEKYLRTKVLLTDKIY